MFAYCKNNPVNMHDNDGYRPNYICNDGGEIGIAGDSIGSTFSKISNNNGSNKVLDRISSVVTSLRGGIAGGVGDSFIGKGASTIVSKITKPIDYLFSIPKVAKISSGIGKVGILNTIALGFNIRDDVSHYNKWDAAGRVVIDLIGFVGVVAFAGLTAEIWAPTLAGFLVGSSISVAVGAGLNFITTKLKDNLFQTKKE
ncbi:hypothetical protein [Clostridium manihotivorum]|uniref:hypothetical protein n=1 Tax=Clostridium manihotivorum TaxID=2320868 RepID=UPI0026A8D848